MVLYQSIPPFQVKIKSCNLTIQNFQTIMDDQCKYNTYTCFFLYNQLWFIDHPKNTLSYSINHVLIKSCISQCSFQFQDFTISNQFNSVLPINSVMPNNSVVQINSVMPINSVVQINSIMQINSVMPINSIMPLTNLTYVFDIQDIRVTGTVPLGYRPVSIGFIT